MTIPPYRAPRWLPGGHAQTIWPLRCTGPLPNFQRERWTTPDGDFIDLDWLPLQPAAPLVVLFHGLEGSSHSPYARALMGHLASLGWNGVVPHFRGCSGEPNRAPRAYHSGDADEIEWILTRMAERFPDRPRYAAGVSLGGNALLLWLGTRDTEARRTIDAAAAICAPLDLAAAGHHLARGFNRVYTRHFLSTLKRSAEAKLDRFPGLFDRAAMLRAETLHAFDNVVTAPLHGFRDTDDYWRRASSKPHLRHIAVPTLVLNARNDPFLPAHHLPDVSQVSSAVHLEHPEEGGHAGFVRGPWPGRLDWLPARLVHFFTNLNGSFHPLKSVMLHCV